MGSKKKIAKIRKQMIEEMKPEPLPELPPIDYNDVKAITMMMDNVMVELKYKNARVRGKEDVGNEIVSQKVLSVGNLCKLYKKGDEIKLGNPHVFTDHPMFQDQMTDIVVCKPFNIICKIGKVKSNK